MAVRASRIAMPMLGLALTSVRVLFEGIILAALVIQLWICFCFLDYH